MRFPRHLTKDFGHHRTRIRDRSFSSAASTRTAAPPAPTRIRSDMSLVYRDLRPSLSPLSVAPIVTTRPSPR